MAAKQAKTPTDTPADAKSTASTATLKTTLPTGVGGPPAVADAPGSGGIDREALREQYRRQVATLLQELAQTSEEEQLAEVSRLTAQVDARAKKLIQQAAAAALSSEFYDGSRGNLAPLLGIGRWAWSDRRRRALGLEDQPWWQRTATQEQIAERARQMNVPHLPQEEARLAELALAAAQAQEEKAALLEVRNEMIRRMYTASFTNPQGRTQPQLAKLAGISDRHIWQIVNPRRERLEKKRNSTAG
jgi:hypothetical protein